MCRDGFILDGGGHSPDSCDIKDRPLTRLETSLLYFQRTEMQALHLGMLAHTLWGWGVGGGGCHMFSLLAGSHQTSRPN